MCGCAIIGLCIAVPSSVFTQPPEYSVRLRWAAPNLTCVARSQSSEGLLPPSTRGLGYSRWHNALFRVSGLQKGLFWPAASSDANSAWLWQSVRSRQPACQRSSSDNADKPGPYQGQHNTRLRICQHDGSCSGVGHSYDFPAYNFVIRTRQSVIPWFANPASSDSPLKCCTQVACTAEGINCSWIWGCFFRSPCISVVLASRAPAPTPAQRERSG